jgi:hypothetical protein
MKFAAKGLFLVSITAVLAGCHGQMQSSQWFPPVKKPGVNSPVNCVELKRQRLYNMTNMNTETNNTTLEQRKELDDLIAKNCK